MSLSLKQDKETQQKDSKSKALLNKYLSEAFYKTHGLTILGTHREASKLAIEPEYQEINRADIEAKRKEIKQDLKEFGFREKLNYMTDVTADNSLFSTAIKMAAVTAVVATTNAVAPEATEIVAGAGLAYVAFRGGLEVNNLAQTDKQDRKTSDYVELKHAQIALKKLSNHLENKELKQMRQDAMTKGLLTPLTGRGGRF